MFSFGVVDIADVLEAVELSLRSKVELSSREEDADADAETKRREEKEHRCDLLNFLL